MKFVAMDGLLYRRFKMQWLKAAAFTFVVCTAFTAVLFVAIWTMDMFLNWVFNL